MICEYNNKLKWAAVRKFKDCGYIYTTVQVQTDGNDLVFKISGTYRENPLRCFFYRIRDYKRYTWNDIALIFCDYGIETRHLHDALLWFYKEFSDKY